MEAAAPAGSAPGFRLRDRSAADGDSVFVACGIGEVLIQFAPGGAAGAVLTAPAGGERTQDKAEKRGE